MLDVLKEEYIRTASAKGLRQRTVILRHALRSALYPVVAYLVRQQLDWLADHLSLRRSSLFPDGAVFC